MKFLYLAELSKQKFDETGDSVTSWIMAMPVGTYQHPRYGKLSFTQDRIKQFADNVNSGVRGQKLDIDYDHKEYNGEAAGWVEQAEARPDGLWLLVEWTQKAYEAIKSKAYRYFSPEFDDMWKDPRTGEKFKDVLAGGGITNRPFLKGIQPLNLSEFFDERVALKENGSMDPDQLRELASKLGLDENATAEMVFGALMVKLGGAVKEDKPPEPPKPDAPNPDAPKPPAQNDEDGGQPVAFSEKDIANHPTVKKLTENLEAMTKKFAEQALESNTKKLSDIFVEKTSRELTPVVESGIKKLLSESPSEEYTETLVKTLSEMLSEQGPISGELGGSKKVLKTDDDKTKKFQESIKKLMDADKELSYGEAAVRAAAEDESMFDEYRQDSYLVEGI